MNGGKESHQTLLQLRVRGGSVWRRIGFGSKFEWGQMKVKNKTLTKRKDLRSTQGKTNLLSDLSQK